MVLVACSYSCLHSAMDCVRMRYVRLLCVAVGMPCVPRLEVDVEEPWHNVDP